MPKWARVLIILGIVIFVGGIYSWFFGIQTVSALLVRYTYRKMPEVAKTPMPLSDVSVSSVSHKTVSYFGYEFELPWDDVDEQKDKTFGTVHVCYSAQEMPFGFPHFRQKIL